MTGRGETLMLMLVGALGLACINVAAIHGGASCDVGSSTSCAPGYSCDPTTSTCHRIGQTFDGGPPSPDAGHPPPVDAACVGSGAANTPTGAACGCGTECASGFCVDGVCCDSACAETCKSCNTAAAPGACSFVPPGAAPRAASMCPKADQSTCGLDGTCDGAGGCRKYTAGSLCQAGTCDGAAVVGLSACDGGGRCTPSSAIVCAPFNCDPQTSGCFAACMSNAGCSVGNMCGNGSCGVRMKGANCTKNDDCASGFCTDGVCCAVACQGGCVACNLVGREGTCWTVEPGVADPRGLCVDQGAASCGTTGACDGFGGCEKYAAETQCIAPSCTGTRRNTAGTCDGLGTCRPQGVQNCSPFKCVVGACKTGCNSDADCDTGHACVAGSCGLKQNGQTCAKDAECTNGHCVDGVCCAEACVGACRSCALPSSMGRCVSVPAGVLDPRATCVDTGAASCATDGHCDGAGACRKYSVGTTCASEHCESNAYTPASTCSAMGQCVAPTSLPCTPFSCNGSRCFASCASTAACVAPNVCNGNSCGKKSIGAFCSDKSECQSAVCAQGVCCATACSGACKSCGLPSSLGVCSDVPTGAPDPSNTCVAQGAASCGTNGLCQAGACQKYAAGTSCGAASCPAGGSTSTPASTCDGVGACVTPTAVSCLPFLCGAVACKASCSGDADCAPPSVCVNASCGLKSPGAVCADGAECISGSCPMGFCS